MPGFVRPQSHLPFMPVRFWVDPDNHAFSKIVVFRKAFLRRIIEAYIAYISPRRCGACHAGWPDRPTSCFLCKQIPFKEPSATYVLDGVTWILAPTDGRPTWIKALGSPEEATDANSAKLTQSINATKMA